MFCVIRALFICVVFLVESANAEFKSEIITLSKIQEKKSTFGIELSLEVLPKSIDQVPVRILCNRANTTPPLAIDETVFGKNVSLLNLTASSEGGCRSYTVDILLAQLVVDKPPAKTQEIRIAVGINSLKMDPKDSRFGKPHVFVFNPVHGNWTKSKAFRPNQAVPQRSYATLSKRSQQIISGSISAPEAANIDVASHDKRVLSKTTNNINPTDGLMSVSPVEPDAMGSAQVKLPLLLRPSRGPGPSFSIVNSPTGAPGVLGRGWDLNFSKISVRGPSPLYHQSLETEDYVLDGQDLIALDGKGVEIPPLLKGGPILARVEPVRVFRTRDGSNGLIIRRYGKTPENYYWEVWDPRSRITRLYGAKLVDNGPDGDGKKLKRETNAILRGKVIFMDSTSQSRSVDGAWGITQEYDNQKARSGASYRYETPVCIDNWTGDCTHALRLNEIAYNEAYGSALSETAESGKTVVKFDWTERIQRQRYNSDGRLGFFRAQQYWLDNIEVRYKPPSHSPLLASTQSPGELSLFSKHEFQLSGGDDNPCMNFSKVLKTVKVTANEKYNVLFAGDDDTPSKTQVFQFEYDGERSCQDYVWEQKLISYDNSIGQKVSSGIGFPNALLKGLGFEILTNGSILGETNSEETGGSLYVGVGPPDSTSRKSISGGIKAGYTFSKNRTGSTLLDVTGDGIDDVVYRTNSGLKYCAAQRHQSDNSISFTTRNDACDRPIYGLNDINVASSSITSVGAEVHFGIGFAGTGFNSSKNETYVYFSQRDNDGLVDAVVYGKVLYNQGEICSSPNKDCSVTFTPNSSLTPPLPSFSTEVAANLIEEIKTRKPPGLEETIRRMGKKLSAVSARLSAHDYSQTTVTWVAPLDGEVSLSGKFDLTTKPDSSGKRMFPERNELVEIFEKYHNDCTIWPTQPRCNPVSPVSFNFIAIPKAFINLSISQAPDLSLPEKDRGGGNGGLVTTPNDTIHKVVNCATIELDRTRNFDLNALLKEADIVCKGKNPGSETLRLRTNDVVYLTYSVHPDYTASLAPNSIIQYADVENDGSWLFRPANKEVGLRDLISCQWGDHESAIEIKGKERCLIGKQNAYAFDLSSGLLPTDQNGTIVLPTAASDEELDQKSRKITGKFSIPADLTRDYQVYFDIHGTTLAEQRQKKLPVLPIMFRQDISKQCEPTSGQECIVELALAPVCSNTENPIFAKPEFCGSFYVNDSEPFVLNSRLSIKHKNSGSAVPSLSARLSKLRWLAPPTILTKFKEVKDNENKEFEQPIPQINIEKALLTNDVSKIVSIYLPFQVGDIDTEFRRVEHGIFKAPNSDLNDSAGTPEVDIDFHTIMKLEQKNVQVARLRQRYRLCGFAFEILEFLQARYSKNVLPYVPSYLDYWEKRITSFRSTCKNTEIFLKTELTFTDGEGPDFDLSNRLELHNRLQLLELEDQISSAETLLERVLSRLELRNELLTDHPRLTRRGYRLPVKANPLDCEFLRNPESNIKEPITGPDSECQYRFLANFAMHDIAKLLYPSQLDPKIPAPLNGIEVNGYQTFVETVFPKGKAEAAFNIEISALVNGNPVAFLELTGSAASSKDKKFPVGNTQDGRPLRNTCIGRYGVHDINEIERYHYPDKDAEFFQRIVTNRRSGRVVAFSDDIMSTAVRGKNAQNEYQSIADMELKQDCKGLSGQTGPNSKFKGPPNDILSFDILENNRFIGRNRVFEFTAKPLDVVEFRVRLAPVGKLTTAQDGTTQFELLGNYSAFSTPFVPATERVLIPRAPSQIVPPLLAKPTCDKPVRHPNWTQQNQLDDIVNPLGSACRPWTRLGWTELLLGASYRTYSDHHRTKDDLSYSLKRRREILRLQPEIEIDATRYRLDLEMPNHMLASSLYKSVSQAAARLADVGSKAIVKQQQIVRESADQRDISRRKEVLLSREEKLSADIKLAQARVTQSGILERIGFAQERSPNTMQAGINWSIFASKALANGDLKPHAGYDVIRFKTQRIPGNLGIPDERFNKADAECVDRSGPTHGASPFNPNFENCEANLEKDGNDTLALTDVEVFPLIHRFIGPIHESASIPITRSSDTDAEFGVLITDTDICASPFPKETASCWKGQDDTVYLHRKVSPETSGPPSEIGHGVKSVSALIGFELPLIEQFLFEFDAYKRVACNWPHPSIEVVCEEVPASPPLSDADKLTIAEYEKHKTQASSPKLVHPSPLDNPVVGRLPAYPNRPNPPVTDNVLEVFAPIQRSKTRSVSTNSGLSLGLVSVNTSVVFNESETQTVYLDINGDGFPEIINDGGAKLTSPVGLTRDDWWRYFKPPSNSSALHGSGSSGYVQNSKSNTYGAGVGLTPPSFAKIKLKTMDASVSPSFDFSFEKGMQTRFRDFRDFNGDGIVDTINSTDGNISTNGGLYVGFNIGNSIRGQTERLTVPSATLEGYKFRNHYNTTNSAGFGVRLGYQTDSGSVVAGMGLGNRIHSSEGMLMDFTGDGLVDIVVPANGNGGNGIIVYPNLGNGFSHARLHKLPGWSGSESSVSETTLVDAGAAYTFGFKAVYVKVVFNPGIKHARSQKRELLHIRDMNADGFPDLVSVSGLFDGANVSGAPSLSLKSKVETKVYYNPTPKFHLLSKITNPSQTEYEFDYVLHGNSGPELGKPIWAMTKVSEFDGFDADQDTTELYPDGHDITLKSYEYKNGYFNRAEGSFYGFSDSIKTTSGCGGTPEQIKPLTNCSKTVLQKAQRHFYNRDFLTKGRLLAQLVSAPKNTGVKHGTDIEIQSATELERVSIARAGYSLDDLQTIQKVQSPTCSTIPQSRSPVRWSHANYAPSSKLSPRWSKVNPKNTNNGQLLGKSTICKKDLLNCVNELTQNLCSTGFYAEQTQFWALQSASVRERISDLFVYAPGTAANYHTEQKDIVPLKTIDLKIEKAIYSAAAIDHDQWGHPVTSYSVGELSIETNNQPISKASINSETQYSDQNSLNINVARDIQGQTISGTQPYPIAGLANEVQLFEGAWPDSRGPPTRIRQAIYSQDNRANLTDICHYPGGKGFVYQADRDNKLNSGICAKYKATLYSNLSDGLTSLQDALRATYDSVEGIPRGDKDFTALIHSQFDYDKFGNLAKTISPLNKDREWIERQFNYENDPFFQTPTNIVHQRCVHDRRGVGDDSHIITHDPSEKQKNPKLFLIENACQFGTGSTFTAEARKDINHVLERGIDAHHGNINFTKDPNGNGLLTDFDAWGRFRLLARDWGTAPRQNRTYEKDVFAAATKSGKELDQTKPWRVMTIANYAWPQKDRNYVSSHVRHFASSNAYAGALGTFDTTRHASNFADSAGNPIQSVVEAEVCKDISRDLLDSKNYPPTAGLSGRCGVISSGRVSPASARDALGRQLASFEGYEISNTIEQGGSGPMFGSLFGLSQAKKPLTTNKLDSGGRMLTVRSRIADAPHSSPPNTVTGTTQYAYRVVQRKNLDEGLPVNRFEAITMSPRCAIKATRSDARGLITSVVENQSTMYRQTGDEVPDLVGASDGIYSRNHADTLGFCKPIEEVVSTWPNDAEGPEAAKVNYEYDSLSQIRKVNYPLEIKRNNKGEVARDEEGNPEVHRAAISVDYDLHGRLIEMRDPDSGCSQFNFDAMHNLTAETRFAFEGKSKVACGENSKVSSNKYYEHAADRLMQMTYSSLQQQGSDEDKRDTVNFFYDRYPHVSEDGEILEAPKLIPNDHANRRFINVTGKICENCIGQTTVITDRTGGRSFSFNELSQPKKETRSIIGRLTNVVPSEGGSEAFVPEVAFYELENSYSAFGDLTLQEFNEGVPSNPSPQCANASDGGSQNCIARFTLGTRYAPDGSVSTLLFNGQPLVHSAKDQINRPAVRWTHDGTTSGYFYDPFDLRMNKVATITAGISNGKNVPVQINGYQYDGGGNVLGYRNHAEQKESYKSLFNFGYDGVNRLTTFTNSTSKIFKPGNPKESLEARGCYQYDLGHRFSSRELLIAANPSDDVNKLCRDEFVNDDGPLFARKWTYNYNNAPSASKPVHAPSKINFEVQSTGIPTSNRSTLFDYDDLGRMKKSVSGADANGPGVLSNRAMVWDAEGRLKSVRGGKDEYWKHNTDLLSEKYVYDFGGNRTLKIHRPVKGGDEEKKAEEHTTIYVTPFYVRSATGRGSVQIAHGSFPVATLVPPKNENSEPTVTFLYSDLAVGSATASVMATGDVSDANATVISRREYSPYGHNLTAGPLAQPKRSNNFPLSVFHGKELDRATGFSSFGARYYSRDIGIWLSPDPLQNSYLFGRPNSGVYKTKQISSYGFVNLNPIQIIDPTGLCGEKERIDGCLVLKKSGPTTKDGSFVDPKSTIGINARAIFGSSGGRSADFSEVSLADVGASVQAYANNQESKLREAIVLSSASGKPVNITISGLIAAKSVGRSKTPFSQQGGIGRFSVSISGVVAANKAGNWMLKGSVTGEPDLQDYPYDSNRSGVGTIGTFVLGGMQKLFGGKDYTVKFKGQQFIDVQGKIKIIENQTNLEMK